MFICLMIIFVLVFDFDQLWTVWNSFFCQFFSYFFRTSSALNLVLLAYNQFGPALYYFSSKFLRWLIHFLNSLLLWIISVMTRIFFRSLIFSTHFVVTECCGSGSGKLTRLPLADEMLLKSSMKHLFSWLVEVWLLEILTVLKFTVFQIVSVFHLLFFIFFGHNSHMCAGAFFAMFI